MALGAVVKFLVFILFYFFFPFLSLVQYRCSSSMGLELLICVVELGTTQINNSESTDYEHRYAQQTQVPRYLIFNNAMVVRCDKALFASTTAVGQAQVVGIVSQVSNSIHGIYYLCANGNSW